MKIYLHKVICIIFALFLFSCTKQNENSNSTSSTSNSTTSTTSTKITTSLITTTTTTTSQTTSESTSEVTTTTTKQTSITRSDRVIIRTLDFSQAIFSLLDSKSQVTKQIELNETMVSSLHDATNSIYEVNIQEGLPVYEIDLPENKLYIYHVDDMYYISFDASSYHLAFKETDFFSKMDAYFKDTIHNMMILSQEEVYTIDDYFLNVPYDEIQQVYTLDVEQPSNAYSLKSYYDFANEMYTTSFFDTNLFSMNEVRFDYKEQIGYINSCIYDFNGVSYSKCSEEEVNLLMIHKTRFLHDTSRFMEPVNFYKELGYEDLTLLSKYSDILYSTYDESLYVDRYLLDDISKEGPNIDITSPITKINDDIQFADLIVKAKVLSFETIDLGELFNGYENYEYYQKVEFQVSSTIKGETFTTITVFYPGGGKNGNYTNINSYQNPQTKGEYILLLKPIVNEENAPIFTPFELTSPNDMMYFENNKLLIWKELASSCDFKGQVDIKRVIDYIKEYIEYLNKLEVKEEFN